MSVASSSTAVSPSIAGTESPRQVHRESQLAVPIPGKVVIAASFTAEPVDETVQFWLKKLGLAYELEFAPYSQVFQQLLDPGSVLAGNTVGVNAVLIRLEDWLRNDSAGDKERDGAGAGSVQEVIARNAQDLVEALRAAIKRMATPHVLAICPASPHVSEVYAGVLQSVEESMRQQLAGLDGLYFIGSAGLCQGFGAADFYDERSDSLGHIPYTLKFYAALGTSLVRKLHALKQSPHKVIALDCDQTLWKGVCGEDGPMGIELDDPRRELQQFMVEQSRAGMLLCLCSKNVEEDVWAVFDQREDMPLKKSDLVAWRINWQSKSENLRALADELNLGLDSFIFIDDNPVECSEVQARCPEVLTLELPQQVDQIPRFLANVWPFDHLKVTDADQKRTELYKQNLERERFQQAGLDFGSFIEGLQLEIDIAPMSADDLSRVGQLTQRTNQFNATTIRRSESEVQQWCAADGHHCLTVKVRDRFGDYGLVGLTLCAVKEQALVVDTFLLSCRVLGRGVEHRMLARLGELAVESGAATVTLRYVPTAKNQPIANFFGAVGKEYQQQGEVGIDYALPAEYARDLKFRPDTVTAVGSRDVEVQGSELRDRKMVELNAAEATANKSARWNEVARVLTTPERVLDEVNRELRKHRSLPSESSSPVSPRNEAESVLAEIWAEVLRLDQVGVQENFFELGGTSVLAVGIFTRIEDRFGRHLPITTLLTAPTIELLARALEDEVGHATWGNLVPVRTHGSRIPLFLIHGGLGDVLGVTDIAQHLADEQPVYALRGSGLDGVEKPLETVEAMASTYVDAIKKVCPHGPYRFVGQCSGGVVAFEMAQQLVSAGERVDFLGLLETAHPQLENHYVNRCIMYYWHRPTYRHGLFDYRYYLLNFVASYYAVKRVISPLKREFMAQNWRGRLRFLSIEPYVRAWKNWKAGAFSADSSSLSDPSEDAMGLVEQGAASGGTRSCVSATTKSGASERKAQFVKDRFYETFLRAQARYKPKPYSGSIDFFLTNQDTWVARYHPLDPRGFIVRPIKPADVKPPLRYGWDQLVANGQFRVHSIPSPHPRMLAEPYISMLGSVLESRLASLSGDAPEPR